MCRVTKIEYIFFRSYCLVAFDFTRISSVFFFVCVVSDKFVYCAKSVRYRVYIALRIGDDRIWEITRDFCCRSSKRIARSEEVKRSFIWLSVFAASGQCERKDRGYRTMWTIWRTHSVISLLFVANPIQLTDYKNLNDKKESSIR